MQFPQIRLNQVHAQIGLRTTRPVQEISQAPAAVSIRQVASEMSIERTPSRLEIDQEQAWNQRNLKKLPVLVRDMADSSRQEGLEAIAQIASEGDQMAKIENKDNAIASIANGKASPPPADFNIAFIPSHGSVRIHYTPSELEIRWKQGGAQIEASQNRPVHEYTPGKTEVYLRQRNSLEIEFTGNHVNRYS